MLCCTYFWLTQKIATMQAEKKSRHRQCQSSFFLNIIMNPASKIASTNWIDNKWRETNWKGLVGLNPDPVGRPTTVKNCANSNEVSAFWTENKWTSWRFALLFFVPVHNGVNYSMKSWFFLKGCFLSMASRWLMQILHIFEFSPAS